MVFGEALKALQLINAAKQLADGVQGAQQRGVDPLRYLLSDGWEQATQAADQLRPGASGLANGIRREIEQFSGRAGVIEGDYRVLDEGPGRMPWASMVESVLRRTWGGHVLLGQPGSGKTTLACTLARHWHARTGYRVEAVNMYGEDLPPGAVTIGMETLQGRMQYLAACLKSLNVDDDHPEGEVAEDRYDALDRLVASVGRRIIIIDEASLGMGNTGSDPARRAALQSLAQCRHLEWLICYIGQWAGQIPLPLFGLTTLFVKQPTGEEEDTDRDNRVVRALWRDATAGFAAIRQSPYWAHWPDPRAWSYVRVPAGAGGARAYRGMAPSGPDRLQEAA